MTFETTTSIMLHSTHGELLLASRLSPSESIRLAARVSERFYEKCMISTFPGL